MLIPYLNLVTSLSLWAYFQQRKFNWDIWFRLSKLQWSGILLKEDKCKSGYWRCLVLFLVWHLSLPLNYFQDKTPKDVYSDGHWTSVPEIVGWTVLMQMPSGVKMRWSSLAPPQVRLRSSSVLLMVDFVVTLKNAWKGDCNMVERKICPKNENKFFYIS